MAQYPTVQAWLERGDVAPTLATQVGQVDVSDRKLRVLGHVVVDSMPSVTGTFWQSIQPVSIQSVSGGLALGTGIADGDPQALRVSIADASDAGNAIIRISHKKIASSTYAPLLFKNLGADATLNVKNGPGNVFSFSCHSVMSGLGLAVGPFIQLHNTATVPAPGAVPRFTFLAPRGTQIIVGTDFFTDEGCHFDTGIAFAFSTTLNTYSAGTAANQSTWIQYV